jgi:hypothetical protein
VEKFNIVVCLKLEWLEVGFAGYLTRNVKFAWFIAKAQPYWVRKGIILGHFFCFLPSGTI